MEGAAQVKSTTVVERRTLMMMMMLDVNVPSCCCGINKLTHIYYTYKVNTTRNTVCFIKHIFLIVLKTYLHIVIHIYKPS